MAVHKTTQGKGAGSRARPFTAGQPDRLLRQNRITATAGRRGIRWFPPKRVGVLPGINRKALVLLG